MFTHRHYVPVLRWKGGEQKALLKMAPEIRRCITPLLEIVPKQLEGARGSNERPDRSPTIGDGRNQSLWIFICYLMKLLQIRLSVSVKRQRNIQSRSRSALD